MGNCLTTRSLNNCKIDNTPDYNFRGETRYAKVLDCYDGDTITIAVQLETEIFKMKVRMYGYDSPELKPPKAQLDRLSEIDAAIVSRQALIDKIKDKIVKILIHDFDKYGRLLATVYIEHPKLFCGIPCCCYTDSENINEFMINNDYGYRYDGGKKIPFSEISKNKKNNK